MIKERLIWVLVVVENKFVFVKYFFSLKYSMKHLDGTIDQLFVQLKSFLQSSFIQNNSFESTWNDLEKLLSINMISFIYLKIDYTMVIQCFWTKSWWKLFNNDQYWKSWSWCFNLFNSISKCVTFQSLNGSMDVILMGQLNDRLMNQLNVNNCWSN